MLILDPKTGIRLSYCKGLDDFYREIGCDTIDITSRRICGKSFDIIVDDEGLLKEGAETKVSALVQQDGQLAPQLVGTLIFTNHDAAGNTTDLSLDDTFLISSRIHKFTCRNRENDQEHENYCVVLDPVEPITETDIAAWLGGD